MIDMVGIGPFITIPLILSAMGGGRAMLAWLLGALLAISDGLVTAELAAELPASGGTYVFTAESWFRELPEGVPGAIRIFVNLISPATTH